MSESSINEPRMRPRDSSITSVDSGLMSDTDTPLQSDDRQQDPLIDDRLASDHTDTPLQSADKQQVLELARRVEHLESEQRQMKDEHRQLIEQMRMMEVPSGRLTPEQSEKMMEGSEKPKYDSPLVFKKAKNHPLSRTCAIEIDESHAQRICVFRRTQMGRKAHSEIAPVSLVLNSHLAIPIILAIKSCSTCAVI